MNIKTIIQRLRGSKNALRKIQQGFPQSFFDPPLEPGSATESSCDHVGPWAMPRPTSDHSTMTSMMIMILDAASGQISSQYSWRGVSARCVVHDITIMESYWSTPYDKSPEKHFEIWRNVDL